MIQETWTGICGTQCMLWRERAFQVFRFLQQCECSYQCWDVLMDHWVFGSWCLETTQWHSVTSHRNQYLKQHSFPPQYFHMLSWCKSAHILMKISIQVNTRPLLQQNVSSDSVSLCKPSGEKLSISLRRTNNNNRLHAQSKHLNRSYHQQQGRVLGSLPPTL